MRTFPKVEAPQICILSHQRSGTHLLQSLLASHPKVHGRGEFILQYRKMLRGDTRYLSPDEGDRIFLNQPGRTNVAIVMYSQLDTFEALLGSIYEHSTIHLLRDPEKVACSILQMEANRQRQGDRYRAHYHQHESLPANEPYSKDQLQTLVERVQSRQLEIRGKLAAHSRLLTLTYEELTGDKDTSALQGALADQLLRFVQLEAAPLTTTLRKW